MSAAEKKTERAWTQLAESLPRPRAILFDWDNTLVDTWPVIHAALAETFEKAGHPVWSLDDVKAKVRKSMRDSFPEIFGADWEKHGEVYQAAYRARQKEGIRPLLGAEAMLESLQNQGVFLGVVSNKKGAPLRLEADNLNWTRFFSVLVGADDAAKDKPSKEPILLALKESGIEPGPDVWFIGDSDIDLETAANCGMTPIFFGEGGTPDVLAAKHYDGQKFHAHALDHAIMQALFAAHLLQAKK